MEFISLIDNRRIKLCNKNQGKYLNKTLIRVLILIAYIIMFLSPRREIKLNLRLDDR